MHAECLWHRESCRICECSVQPAALSQWKSISIDCVSLLFPCKCFKIYSYYESWDTILDCAQGPEGIALMHMYANETNALRPRHVYVPWITINKVRSDAFEPFILNTANAFWRCPGGLPPFAVIQRSANLCLLRLTAEFFSFRNTQWTRIRSRGHRCFWTSVNSTR